MTGSFGKNAKTKEAKKDKGQKKKKNRKGRKAVEHNPDLVGKGTEKKEWKHGG